MAVKLRPPENTLPDLVEVYPRPWAFLSKKGLAEALQLRSLQNVSEHSEQFRVQLKKPEPIIEPKYKPTSVTKAKPRPTSLCKEPERERTVDASPTYPLSYDTVSDESGELAAWFIFASEENAPKFKYPYTAKEKGEHIYRSYRSRSVRAERDALRAVGITPHMGHKARQKRSHSRRSTLTDSISLEEARNHPYAMELCRNKVIEIKRDRELTDVLAKGVMNGITLPRKRELNVLALIEELDAQLATVLEGEALNDSDWDDEDVPWDPMTGVPTQVSVVTTEDSPSSSVDQRGSPAFDLFNSPEGSDEWRYVQSLRFYAENPDYHLDFIDIYTVKDACAWGRFSHIPTDETIMINNSSKYLCWLLNNKHRDDEWRPEEALKAQLSSGYGQQLGMQVHPLYHGDRKVYDRMVEGMQYRRESLILNGVMESNHDLGTFNRGMNREYPRSAYGHQLTAGWSMDHMLQQERKKELAYKIVDDALEKRTLGKFAKWNRDVASLYTPEKCAQYRMQELKSYLIAKRKHREESYNLFTCYVIQKEREVLERVAAKQEVLDEYTAPSDVFSGPPAPSVIKDNVFSIDEHVFTIRLNNALSKLRTKIEGEQDKDVKERALEQLSRTLEG